MRVLVVDDSATALRLACGALRLFGCDAWTAHDGASALELVAKQRLDLILMDCELPDMPGTDVTRTLRGLDGPNRFAPVVGLTATRNDALRKRCREAGMLELLEKPLQGDAFLRVLRMLRPSAQRQDHFEAGAPERALANFNTPAMLGDDGVADG